MVKVIVKTLYITLQNMYLLKLYHGFFKDIMQRNRVLNIDNKNIKHIMKLLLFLERQMNRVTLKTDDIFVCYFCSGKCSPGEHMRLHMDFVILSTQS